MIITNTGLGLNKENNNMNIIDRVKMNKNKNMEALYVGKDINKDLIESMGENIKCNLLNNKQKSLAVMSYSYGSLVGVTTTGVSLGLTVASNPEQYFVNGELNAVKIRKVFKNIGSASKPGYKYKSVFVAGVNKFTVINRFGRAEEFVRVSRFEVQEFDNRLRHVDISVCDIEDLKLIAKDLDVIGRALQELAIDVTKDKSKDIGYNVMNFIETKTKTHSRIVKSGNFVNNINDIIDEHISNKKITSKYALTTEYTTLNKVDATDKNALATAVVQDIAGEMMEQINAGYGAAFEDLIDLFKLTNDSMYKKYFDLLEIAIKALSPEEFKAYATQLAKERKITTQEQYLALANNNNHALNIAHMIRCTIIAISSINNLYGAKEGAASVDSEYIKSVGKKLRAGLYTEGAKLGFDARTVVKIAIAASFAYVNERTNKIAKKNKPSLTELWTIFPKEFVIEYVTGNNNTTINDMLTVKYTSDDLCLGDELTFDDGMAETDFGYVVVAEKYSGKAVVTANGLEAVVDHYSYEPVDVLFIDSVYQENTASISDKYAIPTSFLSYNDTTEQCRSINTLVQSAQANKIVASQEVRDGVQVTVRHLVIKVGDQVSFIGQVLSKNNIKGRITDSIVTNNGAAIFF